MGDNAVSFSRPACCPEAGLLVEVNNILDVEVVYGIVYCLCELALSCLANHGWELPVEIARLNIFLPGLNGLLVCFRQHVERALFDFPIKQLLGYLDTRWLAAAEPAHDQHCRPRLAALYAVHRRLVGGAFGQYARPRPSVLVLVPYRDGVRRSHTELIQDNAHHP